MHHPETFLRPRYFSFISWIIMASLASTPFAPFRRPRIRPVPRLSSSPFAFALIPFSLPLLFLSSFSIYPLLLSFYAAFCSPLAASSPRFTSCRLRSLRPASVHPSRSFSSIQMAKVNFAITNRARRSPRYGATILAQPTPPPPSGEAPIWSREREKGAPYHRPPTIQLYGGSRGAPELTPPLS